MAPQMLISPRVREKLVHKHNVSTDEVAECFANRAGRFLRDVRERHQSNPPTVWFVAETDRGRHLKVAFIPHPGGEFEIRTAYPANEIEKSIYRKHGS